MKKLVILVVLLPIFSCSEEMIEWTEPDVPDTRAAVLYDSPENHPDYLDWENNAEIELAGYGPVFLPWHFGGSDLPFYILKDYTKAQGWELLYNRCYHSEGKYYLIFYNIFTGMLRTFYYNTQVTSN
ncbi:MAG: hypothetical protein LUD68_00755, partial [Rikenellaceae bacterium]|nr:hypothetical protein [Rikenellaceae bacterium]